MRAFVSNVNKYSAIDLHKSLYINALRVQCPIIIPMLSRGGVNKIQIKEGGGGSFALRPESPGDALQHGSYFRPPKCITMNQRSVTPCYRSRKSRDSRALSGNIWQEKCNRKCYRLTLFAPTLYEKRLQSYI